MSCRKLVAVSLLVGVCAPVAGYSDYNPYWNRCSTQSNGNHFENAGQDRETVRGAVINSCQQNRSTDNGECRANAQCDTDQPGDWITCSTSSNDRRFVDGARDPNTARTNVIQSCQQDRYTDNGECNYNVSCNDGAYVPAPPPYPDPQPTYVPAPQPTYVPAPPPYYPPTPQPTYVPAPPPEDPNRNYVCSTQSNGRSFNVPGRGYRQTLAKVIFVCRQAAPYTNANECAANAYCQ